MEKLNQIETSVTEPPIKRSKLFLTDRVNNIIISTIDEYIDKINSSEKNLKPVLSDDFERPLQLISVYVGRVKNVKDISKTIQVLNERLPLKSLQHLKRVRRQDIILCPTSHFDSSVPSIQDFIECFVPELKAVFEFFKEIEVPSYPPQTDTQCQEAKRIWSCNFHPNKYFEKLVSNNFFTLSELKVHRQFMTIAFEVARWYIINNNIEISNDIFENMNATVVVDQKLQSIVALSFDNRREHPIQHSAMLAIDNVAITQNGGAWNQNSDTLKDVLPYIKNKFPHIQFYKNTITAEKGIKEGPYLCTGYYIYTIKEPCVMCAMALVHARAQRIFFCIDNEEHGALKSKTKLQTIASLNHHFEVFTNFIS